MKRRLETEESAVSLALSAAAKRHGAAAASARVLETKYHGDAGDWYVALGWDAGRGEARAVFRMDSVTGTVTGITEV